MLAFKIRLASETCMYLSVMQVNCVRHVVGDVHFLVSLTSAGLKSMNGVAIVSFFWWWDVECKVFNVLNTKKLFI